MTTLAALALIATAAPQGIVKPTSPIVFPPKPPTLTITNVVQNSGFEGLRFWPWETGGSVQYFDTTDYVDWYQVTDPLSGYVTSGGHQSSHCFQMNAGFPSYVIQGNGYSAQTYLKQNLSTQPLGVKIVNASAWVWANWQSVTLTIEYTSGAPTYAYSPSYTGAWQLWDFRSAIDPARYVKSIRFDAVADPFNNTAYAPYFDNIELDDVTIAVLGSA